MKIVSEQQFCPQAFIFEHPFFQQRRKGNS